MSTFFGVIGILAFLIGLVMLLLTWLKRNQRNNL
ncbi:hypothetical protein LLT5_12265 [Lactococcus cremoris subsp. cremoris TIFN5]|nr:hypothetical protein LLT5_12265 [Lactococcus cremoris subsp. cremoris TIFN5]